MMATEIKRLRTMRQVLAECLEGRRRRQEPLAEYLDGVCLAEAIERLDNAINALLGRASCLRCGARPV